MIIDKDYIIINIFFMTSLLYQHEKNIFIKVIILYLPEIKLFIVKFTLQLCKI